MGNNGEAKAFCLVVGRWWDVLGCFGEVMESKHRYFMLFYLWDLSRNGIQKWMVYNGKSHKHMDDDWGYPHFRYGLCLCQWTFAHGSSRWVFFECVGPSIWEASDVPITEIFVGKSTKTGGFIGHTRGRTIHGIWPQRNLKEPEWWTSKDGSRSSFSMKPSIILFPGFAFAGEKMEQGSWPNT